MNISIFLLDDALIVNLWNTMNALSHVKEGTLDVKMDGVICLWIFCLAKSNEIHSIGWSFFGQGEELGSNKWWHNEVTPSYHFPDIGVIWWESKYYVDLYLWVEWEEFFSVIMYIIF